MKVARRVLDDQIKALTDLEDVLKYSRSFNRPDDERHYANMINIPVISSQKPAQTLYALKKLGEVLKDRRSVRGKISGFTNTLSRIGERKDAGALQQTIQEQTRYAEALGESVSAAVQEQTRCAEVQGKSISAAVQEQMRCAEALNNEMTYQGKSISAAIQEQIRCAEALNNEMTYQGKSISAFTALNVFFLPLGFFSQV